MKKAFLVGMNELVTTISRRSFLFVSFGLPVISGIIFIFVSSINQDTRTAIAPLAGLAGSVSTEPEQVIPNGYVDNSHLITIIPSVVTEDKLISFPDQKSARSALEEGSINGYFIISEGYIRTGEIAYYRVDFNPLSISEESGLLEWLIKVNLLNGDAGLANMVNKPFELDVVLLDPPSTRNQDDPLTFLLPYGITFLFYFLIMMSASLLLNAITKEKENSVLEILLSTTTERQILGGKFVGVGIVGLLQTVLWFGTFYLLLILSGQRFDLPDAFQLPTSILFWGIVFFLLGYILYASLMAAVGVLVPNLREASHITLLVIGPLLLPLLMITVLIRDPYGVLAVTLSLIPLTSPVTMITRLSVVPVPAWQILLSLLLLLVTVYLVMRTTVRAFRAQALLAGQPLRFAVIIENIRK